MKNILIILATFSLSSAVVASEPTSVDWKSVEITATDRDLGKISVTANKTDRNILYLKVASELIEREITAPQVFDPILQTLSIQTEGPYDNKKTMSFSICISFGPSIRVKENPFDEEDLNYEWKQHKATFDFTKDNVDTIITKNDEFQMVSSCNL